MVIVQKKVKVELGKFRGKNTIISSLIIIASDNTKGTKETKVCNFIFIVHQ